MALTFGEPRGRSRVYAWLHPMLLDDRSPLKPVLQRLARGRLKASGRLLLVSGVRASVQIDSKLPDRHS